MAKTPDDINESQMAEWERQPKKWSNHDMEDIEDDDSADEDEEVEDLVEDF